MAIAPSFVMPKMGRVSILLNRPEVASWASLILKALEHRCERGIVSYMVVNLKQRQEGPTVNIC